MLWWSTFLLWRPSLLRVTDMEFHCGSMIFSRKTGYHGYQIPPRKQFGNWETDDKPGPHHFWTHPIYMSYDEDLVFALNDHHIVCPSALRILWGRLFGDLRHPHQLHFRRTQWSLHLLGTLDGDGRRMEFQGWWRCLFRWWLPVTWVENCTVWLVCFTFRLKHVETCWNMLKHVETCWNHQASEFHAVNRSSTIFQMTPRWSDFVTCWCDRSGDQFHDLFLMKNLSLGEVPMGSYGSIKLL